MNWGERKIIKTLQRKGISETAFEDIKEAGRALQLKKYLDINPTATTEQITDFIEYLKGSIEQPKKP